MLVFEIETLSGDQIMVIDNLVQGVGDSVMEPDKSAYAVAAFHPSIRS